MRDKFTLNNCSGIKHLRFAHMEDLDSTTNLSGISFMTICKTIPQIYDEGENDPQQVNEFSEEQCLCSGSKVAFSRQ